MKYFNILKNIVKISLRSLTSALLVPITVPVFATTAFAQSSAWQSGRVSCDVESIEDIDFGNIDLVNPIVGKRPFNLNVNCQSNFYIQQQVRPGRFIYTVSGSSCLGISTNNAAEANNQRYLYLNGDPNSAYRLPFNFWYNSTGGGLPIGDGITNDGLVTHSTGVSFRDEPTGSSGLDMMLRFYASFDFTNNGLPPGIYKNNYVLSLWTGAGGPPLGNSHCQGVLPDGPAQRTVTVSVEVLPSCQFSVLQAINFGTYTRLVSNIESSGSLAVNCNINMEYEILLDGGRSQDVNRRSMSLLNGGVYDDSQKIYYNLYLPNSSLVWGNTQGVNTFKETVNSYTQRKIPIRARINGAINPNPRTGLYKDTVVATIIY